MAYTPTVWETGNTVTADKLNNIENGIKALNTLVVKIIDSAMNRTFKQITDAYKVGHAVIILDESTNEYSQISRVNATEHIIECDFGIFIASSDADYPQLDGINSPMYIIDYDSDTYPSYNDITNAVKAGKRVNVLYVDGDYVYSYFFNDAIYDSESEVYKVHFYNYDGDEGSYNLFILQSSTKTDPMTT